MGARSAGNPHAACDVEGAGNVARSGDLPARQSSTLPAWGDEFKKPSTASRFVPTILLDLWFERVVKVRLPGEARLVRYIDDFVICFQYRSDALRVADALRHRLGKFGLTLEPTKTKLVEFGRFAQRHASKRGRNRPETIYFLGLTLYCTRNRKGNFKVGMRTEKSRLRRSLASLRELMRRIRHYAIRDQVSEINAALRGHYAYYGVAGNLRSLIKVYQVVERYWRRMLCSRSRDGGRLSWDTFNQIKERNPLLRPKLRLPHRELQALAVL